MKKSSAFFLKIGYDKKRIEGAKIKMLLKTIGYTFLIGCLVIAGSVCAQDDFAVWKQEFKAQALEAGVSEHTLNKFLPRMALLPQVVQADKKQPEFVSTFWDYIDARLTEDRIQHGKMLLKRYPTWLARISERYQVPKEYILAFWGMETKYGQIMGKTDVLNALTTLAYDQRRRKFFTRELIAFLKILEREKWDSVQGSWAGAFGHFQFMPTTFEAYAVDADENGTRNILVSMPDAFASAANYLHKMGWNPNETWGQEVRLDSNLNLSRMYDGRSKKLSTWKKLGVVPVSGSWKAFENTEAFLSMPMGSNGPLFLTFPNFQRVMKWNKSELYALSVCFLADMLSEQWTEIAHPRSNQKLSTQDVVQIQDHLKDLGYYPEDPDGLVGPKTRQAILTFQKARGIPEDGYPSKELLDILDSYRKELNK